MGRVMVTLAGTQAVGTLDLPAGYLLMPDVPGAADAARALAHGETAVFPGELRWFEAAMGGDVSEAADLLDDAAASGDALAAYNRAVLVGDPHEWNRVHTLVDSVEGSAGETLRAMTATARYTLGLDDVPPDTPVAAVKGSVAGIVHSARASSRLESDDVEGAIDELGEAALSAADESPLLAATILGSRADLLRDGLGDLAGSYADADRALQILPAAASAELRADLQITRALAAQGLAGERRELLVQTVNDLQAALTVFRKDTHPELYALGNQQLALAYLAMPMTDASDQLRLGIAVNALREALTVYRPDTHPTAWATAQLNLANALIYLPSVHAGDNLVEAVELYEEVLAVRPADVDPVGRARVLANQGNALAHLGIRDHATEKLTEARALFEATGDVDAVEAVDGLLAELATAEGE